MKTQNIFLLMPILLLGLLLAFLNSCEKEEEEMIISIEHLTGVVQKGPFINGTQIQMYELNASLSQTGSSFSTQVHSDAGSFEITDIELASNFVEFLANGFYYNEVSGELSSAQLSLNAISDVTDHTTINVNILTHLEKRRVEYLVKEKGENFADAKSTAQSEVIAAFGIDVEQMDDSESLDIIGGTESNAVLLAISVILQGNLNVGQLTELLATIANDMRENGVINNESLMTDLRESTLGLDLETIRDNLEERYSDLGIEADIPDFESYVDLFLSHTATEPTAITTPATDIATNSATLNGIVNPGSAETEVIFEYEEVDNKGRVKSTRQAAVELNQARNGRPVISGKKNTDQTKYDNSATADQSPLNGGIEQEVSVSIESLSPSTTYRFRLKAENEFGIIYSGDAEFTTLGAPPTAATEEATDITPESAVLNASVNPNHLETTVIFQYGLTDEYGSEVVAEQSPIDGSINVSVSALIYGIEPGTTYHFRVVAENDLGQTYGENRQFGTAAFILNVPGSYQGWDPTNDQTVVYSPEQDDLFEGYQYFDEDETEYRYAMGSWDENWGDNDADGAVDPDGNNIVAGDAGVYKLNVDMNEMTHKNLRTEWAVIGDAVSDWATDVPMELDVEYWEENWKVRYTLTTQLETGYFKFRANEAWGPPAGLNYGIDEEAEEGVLLEGGFVNDIPVDTPGEYTIILNLSGPIYTYELIQK